RLHRHHLGAVSFRKGVEGGEVAEMLRTLAVEPDRTGLPLGLGDREKLRAWPHVQLHAMTYERLELVDEGGDEVGALESGRATWASGVGSWPTRPAGWRWTPCSRSSRPRPRLRTRRSRTRWSACCPNSPHTPRGGPSRCAPRLTPRCASRCSGCSGIGRWPTR